jgi:exopolysaccharide/PEP-CTERM locus tyrosine autokinase
LGKIFKALQKAELGKGAHAQLQVKALNKVDAAEETAEAFQSDQAGRATALPSDKGADASSAAEQRAPSPLSVSEQTDRIAAVALRPEKFADAKVTAEATEATPSDQLPGHIDKQLIALISPNSFESEQFKILRSTLLFPSSGVVPKSILITSAVPGEGKSFVASNMAVAIAQNPSNHVLLIDFDLRRPQIHRIFGYTNVKGLSELLADGASLPSVLLKTEVDKLRILAAGNPPSNPSELLSSKQMTNLLFEVRARYDDRLILIDSPPPMAAETRAIARQVDAIIIVVRQGKTKRELVNETIEKLGRDKVVGVVMNRMARSVSNYYGRYKRYYHT